ncbi:MAG: Beta-glucosidase [Acidimicrobiaceae bacterium]|nr:Beta-glucosidase [Acidimicrobiaceae bacterium]
MTLAEKANFVVLQKGHGIENFNGAIPSLCIPSLTLSDGPDGLAGRDTGATQLPSAIGVGASFDLTLAHAVGQVEGEEALVKGVNVIQGPELNLARVPQSGRVFESYGEDPYLTSALGVADIEGIQSQRVMALAKHIGAYAQETARARLNSQVTPRALAELYNVPFEAAVKVAHVAGLMCATGFLNGVTSCADPYTYSTLASWGFTGFVRSDERAARNMTAAFDAGLDLIKPASAATVIGRVKSGALSITYLNRAVRTVLTKMFAFGLIAHPRPAFPFAVATSPAHASVALRAAEESAVLLKDANQVLPLASTTKTVAVVGADAQCPDTTGKGSSEVIPPFIVTPLAALKKALGPRVTVAYAPGGPTSIDVGSLSNVGIVQGTAWPPQKKAQQKHQDGNADLFMEAASNVTNNIVTASAPGSGKGWSHWKAVVRVKRNGAYEISLQQIGDTWFYLNGREILGSAGLHTPSNMTTVVRLRAHTNYALEARWFSVIRQGPPELGIAYVSPQINAAVTVARRSQVAIVFADEMSSEGVDQTGSNLSGDENALIEAVARANPHTIVVLNTGNPVLMPWLDQVQGVVEDWYPGEEDGHAIAAILTGAFDPSARLPITFPATAAEQSVASPAQFPGIDDTVSFGNGPSALDVGYRWYQAHNVAPLFPFGFGLSYTTFSLSNPSVQRESGNINVSLLVTNTGSVRGADVLQVYVKDPAATDEPPEQLRAVARVTLDPGQSREVTLSFPVASLQISSTGGGFQFFPGTYQVSVGNSSSDLPIHLSVNIS